MIVCIEKFGFISIRVFSENLQIFNFDMFFMGFHFLFEVQDAHSAWSSFTGKIMDEVTGQVNEK